MKTISKKDVSKWIKKQALGDPQTGAWGFASRGLDSGGYIWFKDQQTLWEFITDSLPAFEKDSADIENFDQSFAEYSGMVQNLKKATPDFDQLVQFYNKSFGSETELLWIGSFEELLKGKTKFGNFVREEFHESNQPILPAALEDFIEAAGERVGYLGYYQIS
jgi:hypothetical protein